MDLLEGYNGTDWIAWRMSKHRLGDRDDSVSMLVPQQQDARPEAEWSDLFAARDGGQQCAMG